MCRHNSWENQGYPLHYLPAKARRIHVCNGKGRKKTWYILHFSILRWLLSITVSLYVKLNLSLLEDIDDDVEFYMKLSKEESVIVLTGKKQATLVSLGCSDPTRCLDRLESNFFNLTHFRLDMGQWSNNQSLTLDQFDIFIIFIIHVILYNSKLILSLEK